MQVGWQITYFHTLHLLSQKTNSHEVICFTGWISCWYSKVQVGSGTIFHKMPATHPVLAFFFFFFTNSTLPSSSFYACLQKLCRTFLWLSPLLVQQPITLSSKFYSSISKTNIQWQGQTRATVTLTAHSAPVFVIIGSMAYMVPKTKLHLSF